MIITWPELKLIASTNQKECQICEEILNNTINVLNTPVVSDEYLEQNKDVREHLKQIIGR